MRLRHYSRRTDRADVQWIRRFILFHDKRHPAEMALGDRDGNDGGARGSQVFAPPSPPGNDLGVRAYRAGKMASVMDFSAAVVLAACRYAR